MKRSLYLIIYVAAFALAMTACSESEDLANDPNPVKVSKITVSPYPAFTENAQTRSNGVGTFDAGKTAWEAGDEILLIVSGNLGLAVQNITLTYDGTEWVSDKPIYWLVSRTVAMALYAPDWTFPQTPSTKLELKEGAEYGTSEYLYVYSPLLTGEGDITIDFSETPRYYNRLRIAGEPSSTMYVTITNFEPCVTGEYKEYHYTLDTDEKGNAYLYGSWKDGASLTVKGSFDVNGTEKEMILFDKTIGSTPENSSASYVADARPSYKNEGDGTEANPYKICLPQQLASLAEAVNSGAFASVDGGIHVALENDIDLSGYPDWTPIGRSNTHPFVGTFDGQGHTISNMTIKNTNPNDEKEWGLFGRVQDATIKNVRVDGSITLTNFGDMDDGDFYNFDAIGGIAGRCSGTVNFEGCHNNVDISGYGNSSFASIGGIVGFQIDGAVTLVACRNTGNIKASGTVYASSIRTAGLIGTVYSNNNMQTVTAEANYCYAEIYTPTVNFAFYGHVHGENSTIISTVNSNYWMKLNNRPLDVSTAESADGFTEVNGSDVTWQTAMTAMNEYLSINYPDFGYEYVENTGADADKVPLILKSKTAEP